ncbi:MAG: TldD/PmbA family protein, partial [Rhodospirillales bacterium]
MSKVDSKRELLGNLLDRAKASGADSADALFVESISLSVARRLGNPENLERSESADLGLRAFVGKRQAIVSSSDTSDSALDELVTRVVAMAKSVPEDPYCGLADRDQLATDIPDLDMCDDLEPDANVMEGWAQEAEDAARAVEGVSNSEGAEAGWGKYSVALASTNGFSQSYSRSGFSLSASVLAGSGTEMERDYDYSSAVYASDLTAPREIGRSAGEKAVRRLNPRKVETGQVPVVYDPRVSRSIIGHLAGAVSGTAVARGTTFLKDSLEKEIFSTSVNIIDDPLRKRGLRSKPFDGEGLATRPLNIIDKGRLTTWVLDLRSARQLGMQSTGHASRGTSGPPSPSMSNLYLEAGAQSPKELIKNITSGFYITELIGFGVNQVTGDYSRGASGFWIENGELTFPVSEVTVAGKLVDMFANITPAS